MPTTHYLSLLTIVLLLVAIGSGFYAYHKIYALTERLQVPPCHVASINSTMTAGADSGTIVGEIELINTAGAPCSLGGYPKLRIKDADWEWLPVDYIRQQETGASRFLLQADQNALIHLEWENWCNDPPKNPLVFVATMPDTGEKLETPAQTAFDKPLKDTPSCRNSQTSSTVSAGPFTSTLTY